MSNYICNKLGKKTAYIELNTTNEIVSLSNKKDSTPFSYKGFDLFPCQTVTSLPEILCLDYEYFVLDIGVLNTYTAKEFSRCDKQFLVCSLSKWKKQKTLEKINQLLNTTYMQKKKLIVLKNLCVEESKDFIFQKGFLKVLSFPFVSNPFHLETRLFCELGNLLKGD